MIRTDCGKHGLFERLGLSLVKGLALEVFLYVALRMKLCRLPHEDRGLFRADITS